MRIPKHRFKYTKLTKDRIGTKLRARSMILTAVAL